MPENNKFPGCRHDTPTERIVADTAQIETNEHLPSSGSACTGASGNRGPDCPRVVARQQERPIAGKVASEDNVARVPKCAELKFHHEFGVGKVAWMALGEGVDGGS